MKKTTVQSLAFTLLFLCILGIPLLRMNWAGGAISLTENRVLASFPLHFNEDGTIYLSRSSIENWVGDNIGFRQTLLKIYTNLKFKVLGLSTSDLVLMGRDGWYFYTGDNNIEIATGEYPLTVEELQLIAQYQQQISDYYHSLGKEYILMLTPSKVSIYSEYLPMFDETVHTTPADIVEEYLKKYTDVIVYNPKTDLIAHKAERNLYHKTDTHWNDQGAYYVYRGLFQVMKEHGLVDGDPVDVSYIEGTYHGEFSSMLGDATLLAAESAPFASWNTTYKEITEGPEYEQAKSIQLQYNPAFPFNILKNDGTTQKVIEIYGDSQLEAVRKIPLLMAEHFNGVYNFAIRNISTFVDALSNPDVIVFSCSERYINTLLTVPADIPMITEMPDLPEQSAQSIGYQGMWLDYCNGQALPVQGSIDTSLFGNGNTVSLSGWAADFTAMQPLSALYLKVGDYTLRCAYGIDRQSVVDYFDSESLRRTGFSVSFPVEYLKDVSQIQFFEVGTNGYYCYTPVPYLLLN